MRVDVVGDVDVRMPHDVLELRGVHAVAGHLAAERVPAHVRRDLRQLVLVDAVVLLDAPAEVVLPVQGDLRIAVLVQEDEPADTVHDGLLRGSLPSIDDGPEALRDLGGHGHEALSAAGLRPLDVVASARGALELLVDSDEGIVEVDVVHSEAAELGDAQPRVEQDVEPLVVLAVGLVAPGEFQEASLISRAQCVPSDHVVGQDGRELEVEGVPADQVVFLSQLECGPQHTPDAMNGAVGLAKVPLQTDEPLLGVERRHVVNLPCAEGVCLKEVQDGLVAGLRGLSGGRLGICVLAGELQDGRPVGGDVREQVLQDPLFDVAQALARLPAPWCDVFGCQGPRVDAAPCALRVGVAVIVPTIRALALARPQDAVLRIPSIGHCWSPFRMEGSPADGMQILPQQGSDNR